MTEDIPERWAATGPRGTLHGRAARGEYLHLSDRPLGRPPSRHRPRRQVHGPRPVRRRDRERRRSAGDDDPRQGHDLHQRGRRRFGRLASRQGRPRRAGPHPSPLVRRPRPGRRAPRRLHRDRDRRARRPAGDDRRDRARGHRRGSRGPRRFRSPPDDPAALARFAAGPGRRRRATLHAADGREVHRELPRPVAGHRPRRLPGPRSKPLRAGDDPHPQGGRRRAGGARRTPRLRRRRPRARLDAQPDRTSAFAAGTRGRGLGGRQLAAAIC